MPTLPYFCGSLVHFCLISHSPAFYRNLLHYSVITGNTGYIIQDDVNILTTVDRIKVLASKKSPHFELRGLASLIIPGVLLKVVYYFVRALLLVLLLS